MSGNSSCGLSTKRRNLDNAAEQLTPVPSANTVHHYLPDPLRTEIEMLKDKLKALVSHQLPTHVVGSGCQVTIDRMLTPYHGLAHQACDQIRHRAAKAGTSHFHG
ncbi:MAG: hypothetical protein QGH37_20840 [Candidatus Poribacteria bacterium]|jgi:hypothetical protein|nr:hypothetical protein [Candidatus Poribacteria bacterium]MDP6998556.1 hypothetical protein [Candidatus Poribacteria bacterium]